MEPAYAGVCAAIAAAVVLLPFEDNCSVPNLALNVTEWFKYNVRTFADILTFAVRLRASGYAGLGQDLDGTRTATDPQRISGVQA
jgi:hypothetical protein